jgi:hypothetical protein
VIFVTFVVKQPTNSKANSYESTAGVTYGNRGASPVHKQYQSALGNADSMSATRFLEELGKLPLHYQPGSTSHPQTLIASSSRRWWSRRLRTE